MKRTKKMMVALTMAAVMMIMTAVPAQAAYKAELGAYASDIEIGKEYVFESASYPVPGYVAAPDTRPDYTDWLGLSKFWPESPREARQMWHLTNMDTRWKEMPWGDRHEETYYRDGYVKISNHSGSYGSNTLRLVTYTPDGFYWKSERYGDEEATQWFSYKKAYKKDGKQVWRFYNEASGCQLCAGGWGDFYLREVTETDPAQG